MHETNLLLTLIGGLILVLAIVSEAVRRGPLQEPALAVLFGIAVGPAGLGWLDLARWGAPHAILEEAARLTLAIGLMAVALRLGRGELKAFWRPVLLILLIAMPVMFAIPAGLAAALLGVPLLTALLIAGALTPTDPIVASSIVTGKFAEKLLPARIRATLSLESGANDGLAYLFMMLPILLVTAASATAAMERWAIEALLLGLVAPVPLGAALGAGAAKLLARAEDRALVGQYSFSVYTVALSLFTLGAARLLHMDELVAVFAAGLAFNVASRRDEEAAEAHVQESVNRLFTLPAFVLFGLALPWEAWAPIAGPLAAFALAGLALRRLPLFLLLAPLLRRKYRPRDLAYMGWFGPNGVAAIFYALFALRHTGEEMVWTAGSFAILASILIHGLTAAYFTRLFARREQAVAAQLS